jgi:succinate dehydrogenase/fumarate reductase flavoprotein subunit
MEVQFPFWPQNKVEAFGRKHRTGFIIMTLIRLLSTDMTTTAIALWAIITMNLGPMRCHGAEPPSQAVSTKEGRDIILVGAGIAGLSAALDAGRTGAQVTVVDMWSVFGGHAVMSGGLVCMVDTPVQRANGIGDSAELAIGDFLRHGDDANPEWVRFYVTQSRREVYDWLGQLGVEWAGLRKQFPGNSVRRQHEARGRGIGLVTPIYLACLEHTNITFLWNTKATGLRMASNRIVGVDATNLRTGDKVALRAPNVILATGGFESSLQLVREFWPQSLPAGISSSGILLGSGINSVGTGLTIAQNAGAALTNLDHQLFYATGLVHPRDPSFRRGLNSFNLQAIWINAQGRRFVREFEQMPNHKAAVPVMLKQTPPTYWSIFDSKSRPKFFVSGSGWDNPDTVEHEIFANPQMARWVKSART